ncbi:hypothetical protein AArcSl_1977 [Halalkaliarchaeum desulfuricum]|uniref:Cytochrome c oxidase subunit IV n=1 Tax=Halalkaliarchaeum desulfuricum TaxID=2055893 RepID=A0A343TKI0_9EURY|nr:cytochrome C oxidase subunit IV family protein [Halalkaliarchaeum desulfuricum]AUX09602.1 hypothetical protein AArcSl_1977 [Halalkaliarchaeum desulfuricum]
MTSVRQYTLVYVLLLVLAASKWLFFNLPQFDYWTAIGATMVAAFVKTGLIVGYYQHLKQEPRSLTYLMLLSVGLVALLGVAASFSIM